MSPSPVTVLYGSHHTGAVAAAEAGIDNMAAHFGARNADSAAQDIDPEGSPYEPASAAAAVINTANAHSGGGYSYSYDYSQGQPDLSAADGYSYSGGGGGDVTGTGADSAGGAGAIAPSADDGQTYAAVVGYGAATAAATAAASAYSWPSDPEAMLSMLQQQRQQYRSWVAQCASAALAALEAPYASLYHQSAGAAAAGATAAAGDLSFKAIPDDVPGLVEAMDVAGTVRQYLLSLKAAAEMVRDAARAGVNFEALSLPAVDEQYDDPSDAASAEAAEAEFVSAAYGVTSAIAAAQGHLHQVAELAGGPAEALVQEVLNSQPYDALSCAAAAAAAAATGVVAGGAQAAKEEGGGLSLSPSNGLGGCGGRPLLAPLVLKLERVGDGLCRRLRQEANTLMARIQWPPPLVHGGGDGEELTTPGAAARAGVGFGAGVSADGDNGEAVVAVAAFRGFELHAVQARRLVGVLTALTHYQMAVEQRGAFYQLLSGQGSSETEQGPAHGNGSGEGGDVDSDEAGSGAKPLLWAAQALAEPVAAKLRAHFHHAAPTGRLDRPAWLYSTVLEFVRQHGHALASLDDMLACLQLKPHYNMPAEFARAIQDAVLALLRDLRIPALLELRNQSQATANAAAAAGGRGGAGSAAAAAAADSAGDIAAAAAAVTGHEAEEAVEADALLLSLMDASAAYDIAMLPLLGATGARAEADAARAMAMLAAAVAAGGAAFQRRRACDQFDPTAVGTADMHSQYVAVAAEDAQRAAGKTVTLLTHGSVPASASVPALPSLLQAWAAAEGAAALRAIEALAYDESSLLPTEEVAARALGGGFSAFGEPPLSASSANGGRLSLRSGGDGGSSFSGGQAPWQRDTWPPLLAQEAARLLDALVARSKWLSSNPVRQREFLETAAGPMLDLLRRRLVRVVDVAISGGEAVSEEGLPRVCAALCAAHFLDDHLDSLLLTDLAPLVHALKAMMTAAAASSSRGNAAATGEDGSGPVTPLSACSLAPCVPAGKLGGGGGGSFWSGLIAAAAGSGASATNGGVPPSPARLALRDGVTALAVGAAGGGGGSGAAAAPAATAAQVLGDHVRSFSRLHRDGCLKLSRELALGFGRCSVAYRHAIEANPQFPFTPESDDMEEEVAGAEAAGGVGGRADLSGPASSITPSFAPALLFLKATLDRLSRCCDKTTFADVWRGAALSINRFMFNFIATESRFTRAGARQFAADVAGLAQLFAPYSRRGGGAAAAAATSRPGSFPANGHPPTLAASGGFGGIGGGGGGAGQQHFRELQAAARLLCLGDEEAADVMRRASAAAVAAVHSAAATQPGSTTKKAAAAAAAAAAVGDTAGLRADIVSPTHPHPHPHPHTPQPQPPSHARGDPVRGSMSADPVLASAGLACLSPLQIMNVIEHRI